MRRIKGFMLGWPPNSRPPQCLGAAECVHRLGLCHGAHGSHGAHGPPQIGPNGPYAGFKFLGCLDPQIGAHFEPQGVRVQWTPKAGIWRPKAD